MIQPEKHDLPRFAHQGPDISLRYMHQFGADRRFAASTHQAFIVPQNKNATLPSRPLLLDPKPVFTCFACSVQIQFTVINHRVSLA